MARAPGRPRGDGVKAVKRRDRKGKLTHTDYYHRASKTLLGRDLAHATAKAAALDLAQGAERERKSTETLAGLIDDYVLSARYRALKPRSRTMVQLYLRKIAFILGDVDVADITEPVVAALYESLSREIETAEAEAEAARQKGARAKKPRRQRGEWGPMTRHVATHILNKLSLVLSHGIRIGVVKAPNPATRPGGFRIPPRLQVWPEEAIDRVMEATTHPQVRMGMLLLRYTAQRPGDVLSMRWSDVDFREDGSVWLSLVQEKTGARVSLPTRDVLAEALSAVPPEERFGTLVRSPNGTRWAERNFYRAWDRAVERADYRLARELLKRGLSKDQVRPQLCVHMDLQRRDLRRTAMVALAAAGATDLQVAAVSGHDIEHTRAILNTYVPRRGEIAAVAIARWEESDKRKLAARTAFQNPFQKGW